MTHRDDQSAANTQLVLHFLQVLDRQDLEQVAALMTADVHLHFSGLHFDRAGTLEVMRSSYASFGDLRHDVEETIAAGDRVVVRATLRGTHSGVFEGLEPTGKRIEVGQIVIFRLEGDRVAEIHEEVDAMVIMQQLGALPAAG
jgi:steroid delta-isomerase-like uncharacterized protein